MDVPLIETARLRLRGHLSADLDAHAAMLADPQVVRFLGGQALGREEAWRRMMSARGSWALLGYGYWAVERKTDGAYLGLVGFSDYKRDLSPSITGLPEMGWIFASHGQGQGYAFEAGAAILKWADAQLPSQDIPAIIDPANMRSILLAEKLGFSASGQALYRAVPILLLVRPAIRAPIFIG